MNRNARIGLVCLGFALCTALLVQFPPLQAQPGPTARPFDLVIIHGHIIDGTGSPWYSGDVGIRNGRIAAIGNLSDAPRKRTIAADGKVVAPGFIDMLGQSEMTILVDPRLPSKIYQGITTEITGEGNSAAPIDDATIAADRATYDHYTSLPIGEPSANTLLVLRSRAWASISPATWAQHPFAAWFSATPTYNRPQSSWTR